MSEEVRGQTDGGSHGSCDGQGCQPPRGGTSSSTDAGSLGYTSEHVNRRCPLSGFSCLGKQCMCHDSETGECGIGAVLRELRTFLRELLAVVSSSRGH